MPRRLPDSFWPTLGLMLIIILPVTIAAAEIARPLGRAVALSVKYDIPRDALDFDENGRTSLVELLDFGGALTRVVTRGDRRCREFVSPKFGTTLVEVCGASHG